MYVFIYVRILADRLLLFAASACVFHIVLLVVNVSYRFVDWLLAGQVSVRFDLVLFRVVKCTSIHEGVWFGCSVKKAKENKPAI